MKKPKIIYKATNIKTGQVYQGYNYEISEKIGIHRNNISKHALNGTIYKKLWVIEKIKQESYQEIDEKDIKIKWQKTIEDLRKRINNCPWIPEKKKEKKYRLRKPQEVR